MNDQLLLEIVRTRCTVCGFSCWCLIPKGARVLDVNVLAQMRCGFTLTTLTPAHVRVTIPGSSPCGGALRIESARGLAVRQVTVGVGARWNVPEPAVTEMIGGRPGKIVSRGPHTRGAR